MTGQFVWKTDGREVSEDLEKNEEDRYTIINQIEYDIKNTVNYGTQL